MPPIPRFDQAPPDRFQGVQSTQAASKLLTPEQQAELAKRGQFIPGVGAAYAANQPGLNAPQPAAPAQPPTQETVVNPPRPEGSGLRPETVQQLEAVAQANAPAEEEAKKVAEDLEDLEDQFDTDEFGNKVRSLLNNKDRREAIEKRCDPMAIDDLITRGEVRQVVPIVPGTFFPTFRSVGGAEDLFIKRLMSNERGSDQYLLDKYSVMNLTAGLHAINGKPLPTHLNGDGDPDQKAFEGKYRIISRMPLAMLADLSVNYMWFQRRLQRLFVVDNIRGF